MNVWKRLYELTAMGEPDSTGTYSKFFPAEKEKTFPYEDSSEGEFELDEPQDKTDIHGWSHNTPTPSDTRHTAWDPDSKGDKIGEAAGLPMSIGKSSPGQMAGVTPGSAKFGGDPFDSEVDQDELERDGKNPIGEGPGDDMEEPVSDDEISGFESDMEDMQQNFPGTDPPSDIVVVGGAGFFQGLGQALGKGRDIAGIKDGKDPDMPEVSAWSYLEATLVQKI
jgi:hypothetical protein